MDAEELKEYIKEVEQRLNRALCSAEKRINVSVTSVEFRLKESINELDKCIVLVKQKASKIEKSQLTCEGMRKVDDLELEFKNHVGSHKNMKQNKELGITKFRVYAFIFFAFVAMGISIWNAFFKG